jgi:hypothetical protein
MVSYLSDNNLSQAINTHHPLLGLPQRLYFEENAVHGVTLAPYLDIRRHPSRTQCADKSCAFKNQAHFRKNCLEKTI